MNQGFRTIAAFAFTAAALAATAAGCGGSGSPGSGGNSTTSTTGATGGAGGTGPSCQAGAQTCTAAAECPAPAGDCVTATCEAGCCGITNAAPASACASSGGTLCDGNGKCVACLMPIDCAPQTTACVVNSCAGNTCGTTNAAAGSACTDNLGTVCDGSGKCVACVAPTDCPAPSTACVANSCSGNTCGTTNAAAGSACTDNGGMLCDGNGACVACLVTSDCPPPSTVCVIAACNGDACTTTNAAIGTACADAGGVVCDGNGTCVAEHCMDGVLDADESDVDCGGSTCPGCADNLECLAGSDCQSKVCDGATHTCNPASCTDGVTNGTETATDCGGSCVGTGHTCPAGQGCKLSADCQSGVCDGMTLLCSAPVCTDGVKNGAETDVDCGGGTCAKCADTKACAVNADCANNNCLGGTCVSCSDTIKNGSETDVDCGGSCAGCAVGKVCKLDTDCTSLACDALSLTCVANQCNDHRQDGTESDVDCGGSCAQCATGKKCKGDADCTTSACDTTTLTCDSSQCIDGHKDGTETDVDCGGSTCSKCAVGKGCLVDADCATAACDNVTGKCVASRCVDQKKDGAETDVDCGGGTCPTCATGKGCLGNTDCMSNACDAVSFLCVSNQCADNRKDGTETDIDCGGGICARCALGLKCLTDVDCGSNACDAITLTCVANQCADNRQDGTESDVDCGGSTCLACPVGKKCNNNFDCQAGHPCSATTPHVCQ